MKRGFSILLLLSLLLSCRTEGILKNRYLQVQTPTPIIEKQSEDLSVQVEFTIGSQEGYLVSKTTCFNQGTQALTFSYPLFSLSYQHFSDEIKGERELAAGQKEVFIDYWFPKFPNPSAFAEKARLYHNREACFGISSVDDGMLVQIIPFGNWKKEFVVEAEENPIFKLKIEGKTFKPLQFIFPCRYNFEELKLFLGSRLLFAEEEFLPKSYFELLKDSIRNGEYEKAQYCLKKASSLTKQDELMGLQALLLRLDPKLKKSLTSTQLRLLFNPKELEKNPFLLVESAFRKEKVNSLLEGNVFSISQQEDLLFFYYNLGRYKEVCSLVRAFIPHPLFLILKGYLMWGESDYQNNKIEEELEIADRFEPWGIFVNREEWVEPLQWAIVTFPDSWKFRWYLASYYQQIGESQKALSLYDEALTLGEINFYPFYLNYYRLPEKKGQLTAREAKHIFSMTRDTSVHQQILNLLEKDNFLQN